jgi:GDP-6-deoxy-D-talose 4-dehydrogenase
MAIRSSRVLLTGSRGFTGSYLRAVLEARGATVIGLINESDPLDGEHSADLTDAVAVARVVEAVRPDLVVHLGGIAFVGHRDPTSMYAVNTFGSLNLLDALAGLASPPRRVVLASSANVYGIAGGEPIDESNPTRPISHYGASKLAMEVIAGVYGDRLPCIVARPFNYTGPGQSERFLVAKIVEHFARGAARIELGNLDVERDFLDVRTVAGIYADLLDCANADGDAVNLCSGRAVSLRAIIQRMEAMTGRHMEVVTNPEFVRGNEIPRLVGCNRRLRDLLGIEPVMDLDATLGDMLEDAERRLRGLVS